MAHQGRPLAVLEKLLAEKDFADADYFGVSGHLGHVSEAAAIQRALDEVKTDIDAVSLGGESFLVYIVAHGRIRHVLSHNKCAAGDAAATFADASEHISPKIYGEVIPTVGDGVRAQVDGYDGIIIIGPFNCLPFRIAEAILKPLNIRTGMPILTYESDGYAVSPSFIRQVEVHAQQVLEHRGRNPIHNAA